MLRPAHGIDLRPVDLLHRRDRERLEPIHGVLHPPEGAAGVGIEGGIAGAGTDPAQHSLAPEDVRLAAPVDLLARQQDGPPGLGDGGDQRVVLTDRESRAPRGGEIAQPKLGVAKEDCRIEPRSGSQTFVETDHQEGGALAFMREEASESTKRSVLLRIESGSLAPQDGNGAMSPSCWDNSGLGRPRPLRRCARRSRPPARGSPGRHRARRGRSAGLSRSASSRGSRREETPAYRRGRC